MNVRAHQIRSDGLRWAAGAVFDGLSRLWQALVNRRQVVSLLEADDRMLKDIGLTRQDVAGALSAPIDHDPSQYLLRARQERLRNRARHRLGT